MFTLIDFENWERKEHYLHFYNDVRCSYSTCVNIKSERATAISGNALAVDADHQ